MSEPHTTRRAIHHGPDPIHQAVHQPLHSGVHCRPLGRPLRRPLRPQRPRTCARRGRPQWTSGRVDGRQLQPLGVRDVGRSGRMGGWRIGGCAVTGRDQTSAALRAEVARITAAAEARLADLVAPAGSTRAQRAEFRAARRAVWANRQAQIDEITAAYRARDRAARTAASAARSARHRAAGRAQRARQRVDRQARIDEQALTRAMEQETTR